MNRRGFIKLLSALPFAPLSAKMKLGLPIKFLPTKMFFEGDLVRFAYTALIGDKTGTTDVRISKELWEHFQEDITEYANQVAVRRALNTKIHLEADGV
jgi:hypothetical protein